MAIPKFGTDREERINYERMRTYRMKRTRDQMKKDGLGAIISWDPYDVRYITSAYITFPTKWMEAQFIAMPVNGDPIVYAGGSGRPARMREAMPWLKGKIYAGGVATKMARNKEELKPLVDVVGKMMADAGVTNQPLGIDGNQSEFLLAQAFRDVGIKCVDAKATMFDARMIKNQDEIECVRIACANAEAAFADIQDAIRPGVTECELMGVGTKRLYSMGADETLEFVLVSGEFTNPFRIDFTDRQLRPHDLVIIDINGNSWNGYKSCYYRTFSCGKPNDIQKEIYAENLEMIHAGMKAVKVGNTTWDIVKAWPNSPKHWGYKENEWDEVAPLATGHGVGISLHELPRYNIAMTRPNNAVKLEENMVLALETWTGRFGGKDGVRLEEMVAVKKNGYDLLTEWPIEELTECWN